MRLVLEDVCQMRRSAVALLGIYCCKYGLCFSVGLLVTEAANLFIMRGFDGVLRKNLLFPQVKRCENAIKQTFVFS